MADTSALPGTTAVGIHARQQLTPFARDAVSFGGANLAFLVLNAISAFLIPKFVAVEAYGEFKLFLLLGGFAGVLHFGLLDGALVEWAKHPSRLRQDFPAVLSLTLAGSTVASGLAVGVVAWISAGPMRWYFGVELAVFAVAINAITAIQFAMQAERRFVALSTLSVVQPAIFLTILSVLVTITRVSTESIVSAYVSSVVLTVGLHLLSLHDSVDWRWPDSDRVWFLARAFLRTGVFILLANVGFNLVLGLDRLFLGAKYSLVEFAQYSFAASIFYSVCLMIQAVSKVVFPYVSMRDYNRDGRIALLCAQKAVLAIWAIGLTTFFPLAWFIREVLPLYSESIPVLRIALLSLGAVAAVQIVHSGYFRVFGLERRMLLGTCVAIVVFVIALAIASRLSSLVAVAWAAVAAHTSWWITNECLLWRGGDRTVYQTARDLGSMVAIGALFLHWSSSVDVWRGGAYFGCACLLTTLVVGPRTILDMLEQFVFATEGAP